MLQRTTRRALSSLAPSTSASWTTGSARLAVPVSKWQCSSNNTNTTSATTRRSYSIHADHAVQRGLEIEPGKLSITKTTTPKDLVPNQELIFGHSFTGTYISSIHSTLLYPNSTLFSLENTHLHNTYTYMIEQSNMITDACCTHTQTTCSPSNGPPPKAGSPRA